MVNIDPIRVEVEREVPALPGVMAYGTVEEEAVRKVNSIALQVLSDMIENGEDVPERFGFFSRRERLASNQGQA